MSRYSHLTADLSNENSAPTKIARLVGHERSVLDVGCAHGYIAEVLSQQGCRVVGIERDPEDGERARAHCERVLVRDVEEPGWEEELEEGSFDVVLFSDVLEHLRDPARAVRRAVRLLKPESGFIVASVPNVAHVSVRLELLLGSFRPEPLGILDDTHLHFFTRDSLEEMLASCGVAVESWDCTTNEISEQVIADYLRRTGVAYTAELREMLTQFEAVAYQFIIKARPAAGALRPLRKPLDKPLRYMQEIIKEFERLRTSPADLAPPRAGCLRVLQVVHQFLPRHAAGTEIYCSDLSFALARRGHAVRVLSGAPHREDVGTAIHWEGDDAIVVERAPAVRAYRRFGSVGRYFDRFDNPEARVAIRAILDSFRPDVVHVQHLLYLSAELISECRARGIPVVVMLNDYWFLCHRIRLKRRSGELCDGPARGWNCCQCLGAPWVARSHLNPLAVAANVYRYAYLTRQLLKADRILAPSHYLRDVFARNGVAAERIIHCDYGTVSPPPDLAERLAVRPRHECVRFGFLGTLMRDKGVHILIDAFSLLPPGSAELHLFGASVEASYFEHLQRRARNPGIHWHGSVRHGERWRVLAEIDVLVVPSIWHENSPLTIHEAHMARLPVIGSAVGGIPELVQDGVTGRIFPAGDAEGLASCLRTVVADRECLRRWRQAIVPPKTMDEHAGEVEAIYRELCGRRAEAASRSSV